MDILTHTLSGVAAGTVVAGFSSKGFRKKTGIIALGGLGGALPDLDAFSLWSGFDTYIGKALALSHSGKEIYFSKFWYSHHGFLHSITASLLLVFLMACLVFWVKRNSSYNLLQSVKKKQLFYLSFVFGFLLHLLEDMPTPSSVWGGVNFFWPSREYIGGTGQIWWWNNYDIFLIVTGVIVLNCLLLVLRRFIRFDGRKFTVAVFMLGFTLALVQINTRGFDFHYTGHTPKYQEYEAKSKEIQKQLLGEKLYGWMQLFDNQLKIYF
ncbi:metal-dependent hydrolase [Rapidithrix thailandica]|uniref:Metal-dependent hydrolase n=1 Tax=Rapidithrix thailandica TaxID=413964 RepID=A0AAW9SHK3_9BACT